MAHRLSEAAEADLDGILDYTWTRHGPAQAERYYLELRETFGLIAESPHLARERTEFSPPVRIHPHARHLIVYRLAGDDILILPVLHQSMDIGSQL